MFPVLILSLPPSVPPLTLIVFISICQIFFFFLQNRLDNMIIYCHFVYIPNCSFRMKKVQNFMQLWEKMCCQPIHIIVILWICGTEQHGRQGLCSFFITICVAHLGMDFSARHMLWELTVLAFPISSSHC